MTDHDLAYMSALDLAQRIKKGDLSSVEVVANSLSRIDDVNGELNCFCFVYNQQALEQARKADEAIAAGDAIGPLHGVPIAIKDFTPVAGYQRLHQSCQYPVSTKPMANSSFWLFHSSFFFIYFYGVMIILWKFV